MLTATTLLDLYPHRLTLEVSSAQCAQAEKTAQRYRQPAAQQRAYLNQLCLDVLLPYLNAELVEPRLRLWQALPWNSLAWALVTGSAITSGTMRWVLIPSVADDWNELRVPREWTDLPTWAGDNYLAVQVDPEGKWLSVWGYVTHAALKQRSTTDDFGNSAVLTADDLDTDLDALWVSWELGVQERAALVPLPELTSAAVDAAIARLSEAAPERSPRYILPFPEWGALLAQESSLTRLAPSYMTTAPVRLSLHQGADNLTRTLDSSWQAVNNLHETLIAWLRATDLPVLSAPSLAGLSVAHCSSGTTIGLGLVFLAFAPRGLPGVKPAVTQLQTANQKGDEGARRLAIAQLAACFRSRSVLPAAAIAALRTALQETRDEETRWAAADLLWQVQPAKPPGGQYAKRIDWGVQLAGCSVALVVAILPRTAGVASLRIQVVALGSTATLPPDLTLTILDARGNPAIFNDRPATVMAREQDILIQYKFWGERGEHFGVQVSLYGTSLLEALVV